MTGSVGESGVRRKPSVQKASRARKHNRGREPKTSFLVKPEKTEPVKAGNGLLARCVGEQAVKAEGSWQAHPEVVRTVEAGNLIDGSTGDGRSRQNRRSIPGQARGERAGESRKDQSWTYRKD
jgi:hypothetical protein